MNIDEAIMQTESVADLLEFDPMTGEKVSEYRMEYQQAQGIRTVLSELKSLREAADARRVQYGKWVKSESGDDWDGETVCSRCGGVSPNGWHWKFCPHCGKEMDGRCFGNENNG